MKINIIPRKKLGLLSAAFCAVMLTFSHSANAVVIALGFFPDPHVVGTVTPDDPDDLTAESGYINFMIALGLGHSGARLGNTIARSTNMFPAPNNLTKASPVFSVQDSSGSNFVDVGGPDNVYAYVFAKYQNDLSQVWWVGDLTIGVEGFEIPMHGPNEVSVLVHWSLITTTGETIPDGGATIMLLGGALGALGMARRFLISQPVRAL
jgi:hypothetical protein